MYNTVEMSVSQLLKCSRLSVKCHCVMTQLCQLDPGTVDFPKATIQHMFTFTVLMFQNHQIEKNTSSKAKRIQDRQIDRYRRLVERTCWHTLEDRSFLKKKSAHLCLAHSIIVGTPIQSAGQVQRLPQPHPWCLCISCNIRKIIWDIVEIFSKLFLCPHISVLSKIWIFYRSKADVLGVELNNHWKCLFIHFCSQPWKTLKGMQSFHYLKLHGYFWADFFGYKIHLADTNIAAILRVATARN